MLILTLLFWTAWFIIAYTYVIFPILLALFARIFAPRPRNWAESEAIGKTNLNSSAVPISAVIVEKSSENLPRIAMVVAAYNEGKVIAEKLANTWEIDYPADRFMLFIGSDGSSDATVDILRDCRDTRLRYFAFQERRGKISVLNDLLCQVEQAGVDIVVMSDANTMYSSDAVRKLIRHFEDPQVGCVSGELCLEQNGGVSGEGLYWKYEQWIKRNESRLGFMIGCNGAVFAIRPSLYQPLPTSTVVEDFVLSMRILEQGYKVRFEPEARVVEPPCATSHAEMVRKIRIGAGGFQALGLTRSLLHPKHGLCAFAFWGHKVVRWIVPLFLALAMTANIGLILHPFFMATFGLQLLGIALALGAYKAKPETKLPKWTRPISYFYLMNYALFCGFLRFLFKTQRVTWERAVFSEPSGAQAVETVPPVSPSTDAMESEQSPEESAERVEEVVSVGSVAQRPITRRPSEAAAGLTSATDSLQK